MRLVDTVRRTGGDEFVVVAPGSAGVTVARRVLDGIAGLEAIEGHPVSVSAGIARFPQDGPDGESLLAAARAALEGAGAATRHRRRRRPARPSAGLAARREPSAWTASRTPLATTRSGRRLVRRRWVPASAR